MSTFGGAENARQSAANVHFSEWYQYIWLGVLGVLILRNVALHTYEYLHARRLEHEIRQSPSLDEKGGVASKETSRSQLYTAPLLVKIDSWAFRPVVYQLTRVKLAFIAAVLAVNIPFLVVVSTSVKPPRSTYLNVPHAVALRAGFMALAQSPAVFALMGRNSVIGWLTGISYQSLRFAHKVFATAWILLALVHWLGMTFSNLTWAGHTGVVGLYSMPIARFGIITLIGLVFTGLFSLPWFRRRQYEIWLLIHKGAAIVILVGVYHHAPPLRHFTYTAIALWAFERATRLVQFFSLELLLRFRARRPLVKATATLVHGAIVLRVPNAKGGWKAGQHVYISFPSFLKVCWQSHPFSVANVPSLAPLPPSPTNSGSSSPTLASPPSPRSDSNEMLFVLRVQRGMTARLAQRLATRKDSTEKLSIAVEGPYGGMRADVGRFEEVVLVAGGSGITHVMSVLADAVQKVKLNQARTRRIHLIWVIQHVEQSSWLLTALLFTAHLARTLPHLSLSLSFFSTRGPLSHQLSRTSSREPVIAAHQPVTKEAAREGGRKGSLQAQEGAVEELRRVDERLAQRIRVAEGRPDIAREVREFVEQAAGATLVVSCGPTVLTDTVRSEVAHLRTRFPVELDIASYEY
ncbi:hypothetical protein JCM10207_007083 [Rhodosporidiobolus poonsookiae]